MRDKYFYEVMFDDTSIDVSKEVELVWSVANSLRGAYRLYAVPRYDYDQY